MQNDTCCPCGSTEPYQKCCGLYHETFTAPTAENLMRSRYSAFCLANINYIEKTMCGAAMQKFDKAAAEKWAKAVYWLGLKIIKIGNDSDDEHKGYVEFIASFMEKNHIKHIHECSEFKKINGQWFYVDGIKPENSPRSIKIAQNGLCPCNSGKKFKSCHGKKQT